MITVIQVGLDMCMVAAVGDPRLQAGSDVLIEVVFTGYCLVMSFI
jgi:hypothetical protein